MTDLEHAAQRLIDQLGAPSGAVSALVYCDSGGPYLRIMIDPQYWLQLSNLPETFDGYRVRSERRSPASAMA